MRSIGKISYCLCKARTATAKFFLTYVRNRTMILRTISYINSCKTVDRKHMNFPSGRHSKKLKGYTMNISLSDHFTYKKLLRFTFPSIVMMILTSIYGVVDGVFVSNFVGSEAFRLHQYHYAVSHDPRCHRLYDRQRRQCPGGSDLWNPGMKKKGKGDLFPPRLRSDTRWASSLR